MLAYARNFDGTAEGDNRLPVELISRCLWYDKHTEHSEAECDSYSFKQFHDFSCFFSDKLARCWLCKRALYAVGFTRDLQPESPAWCLEPWKVVRGPVSSMGISITGQY